MAEFKKIYVLGRSNVGKSSIIRALTGKTVRYGRRPGVTRAPYRVERGIMTYVDMPGFGFMSGVPAGETERTKREIVGIVEGRGMDLALLVLDSKAFVEICDRWESRDEIPVDVEMHDLLRELGIPYVVVANKMDKAGDVDDTLDGICDRLGLLPPWRQWRDTLVPVSAKTGWGISELRQLISRKLGLS